MCRKSAARLIIFISTVIVFFSATVSWSQDGGIDDTYLRPDRGIDDPHLSPPPKESTPPGPSPIENNSAAKGLDLVIDLIMSEESFSPLDDLNASKVYYGDFNNDGLAGDVYFHPEGYVLYQSPEINGPAYLGPMPLVLNSSQRVGLTRAIPDADYFRADFNGDGVPDTLIRGASSENHSFILSGNNDDASPELLVSFSADTTGNLDAVTTPFNISDRSAHLILNDIDADGSTDIVLGSNIGSETVYISTGLGFVDRELVVDIDIGDAYTYAETAAATYGLNFDPDHSSEQTVEILRGQPGMSQRQAELFEQRYEIVDQKENTADGFSALVLRDRTNSSFVMAVRGTEPIPIIPVWLDLAEADVADIGFDGLASAQSIDLYNYYLELTARAYEPILQFHLKEAHSRRGLDTDFKITHRFEPARDHDGPLIGHNFVVTGHSLGGHLAKVMSRLAPQRVHSVYTYNAPGFDTLSTLVRFQNVNLFFERLKEAEELATSISPSIETQRFNDTRIFNFYVPADLVSNLGRLKPGYRIPIFSETEDDLPVSAHSKSAMAEALAVYDLMNKIDVELSMDTASEILNATIRPADITLETMVNSLFTFMTWGHQFRRRLRMSLTKMRYFVRSRSCLH